ncbi:hypothetical protein GCM10020370_19280 [Paenibacillus hodogayensis]
MIIIKQEVMYFLKQNQGQSFDVREIAEGIKKDQIDVLRALNELVTERKVEMSTFNRYQSK